MWKTLLCGWFLLPCAVLGSTWTGTVSVAGRTAKLVIQIDTEDCHIFIAEPVSVNRSCSITYTTGTWISFRTTSPETDWVGHISATTLVGDFRSAGRLMDDARSDSGDFFVKLEGSPVSSGDRRSSAVSPPDVRPPSERVVVWHDGDKRFYEQGIGYEQLDSDGLTVAVSVRLNGRWLVATVVVTNDSPHDVDVLSGRFSADVGGARQPSVDVARVLTYTTSEYFSQWMSNVSRLNLCNPIYGTGDSATCQAEAQRQMQQERQQVADAQERLRRTALVATTVTPSRNVTGFVYFDSPKTLQRTHHGDVLVEIPLGEHVFRFPFRF